MFLDMTVDAPARAMWQAIKQYNGYSGCGQCIETGEHLDLGPGKKNSRRRCHVYPFNKAFASTTGLAGLRKHDEVKNQALQALRQKRQGKKDFAVQGVVGLSWGFGLPMYDVIRGTAVDYMHCVCEGVIDQLISRWLDKSNSKQGFYLGSKVEEISKELMAITPTCEITRTPRRLGDIKDWKASEKRAFLLYYAVPLLSSYLPSDHLLVLMMLAGGLFRLLKQSISRGELQEAHTYLKLFFAKAPVLYGNQFQTFNVHQLLHLSEVVDDLGPLWSNSCFPFEDYNGDQRDLFHGTKNVDGQIVTAVSVIQKLPEIVRATTTSPQVIEFYEHLTNKRYSNSSLKESISENVHVIGSLERLWRNSALLTDEKRNTLPQHHGKIWMFRRCLIRGTVFHSKSYKRVVARNDYTVEFQYMQSHYYGSIHMYVKVEEKCLRAICSEQKCCCDLTCHYFAIIEILETACQQLPEYIGRSLVKHITRVKASKRYYWFCTYII